MLLILYQFFESLNYYPLVYLPHFKFAPSPLGEDWGEAS